jgi:serine/threonine-protein kinase
MSSASGSPGTVKPGDVLAGKYRVERVLGSGGMGYVVAARHLQLDQLVAMKFLRGGSAEPGTEARTRFLREAKAAVKLRNEHIAKVYDVGTLEDGAPYIVMEHLEGCDLAELAKQRHVLPVDEVCEYVLQACEALAEAHALHIVHRDIKLANLFVTRGPAGGPLVKVLDFGISKTNPFGESEHDMTRTASMLGSPRFMSPEQMRDPRAVDGRTDIWALGVVIYRLISGRPPFEADTLGRLLTMVMHEKEVPLASLRKDLPPGFAEVVDRCLEKEPDERFLNVAELAYALVPFAGDQARARSAAERIGAVLSVPHATPSDFSVPKGFGPQPSERASRGDGTASPWSGTHDTSSGARLLGSRGTAVWAGIAFVALAVAYLGKRGLEHRSAAAHDPDPAAAAAVAPTPMPTIAPAGAPELRAPSEPSIIGASPIAPIPAMTITLSNAPVATEKEPSPPPRRAATPISRPRAAPPARPSGPATRPESGIPATRD